MIMLDQLGHMQAPTAVSLLSALLEHPKVQEGLCDGYKAFEEF